jgi:translation elongation factor EF-4
MIEIIPCILSGHHRLRIFFNGSKKKKAICTWKQNNALLKDNLVKEEIKEKIKDFQNLMKMNAKHTKIIEQNEINAKRKNKSSKCYGTK